MLTPFPFDLCHFWNMQRIDTVTQIPEDEPLFYNIMRSLLDDFWSREPGKLQINITMLQNMRVTAR